MRYVFLFISESVMMMAGVFGGSISLARLKARSSVMLLVGGSPQTTKGNRMVLECRGVVG